MVHHLDREVGHFRMQKGKNKMKITYPQKDEPEEEADQAPEHQRVENVKGAKNIEFIKTQDNPLVPPLE